MRKRGAALVSPGTCRLLRSCSRSHTGALADAAANEDRQDGRRHAEWQRDLSISHNKIGDVKQAQGDGDGALDAFRASLAIRERLAVQDPRNAGWQRDLVLSVGRIGDVLTQQRDREALAWCRRAQDLATSWAARFPQGNGRELLDWTDRLVTAAEAVP